MKNYITNKYSSGGKLILTEKAVNGLRQYKPRGCPFENYSLLDLLSDLVKMYSWKICGVISVTNFIHLLQLENYEKAVIYGNAIVTLIEEE